MLTYLISFAGSHSKKSMMAGRKRIQACQAPKICFGPINFTALSPSYSRTAWQLLFVLILPSSFRAPNPSSIAMRPKQRPIILWLRDLLRSRKRKSHEGRTTASSDMSDRQNLGGPTSTVEGSRNVLHLPGSEYYVVKY